MTERRIGLVLTAEQRRALDEVRPYVDRLDAEFGVEWEIGPCHPWNGTVERPYVKRRTPMVGGLSAP